MAEDTVEGERIGKPPSNVMENDSTEVNIKVSDLFGTAGGAGEIGRRIAAYDVNGGRHVPVVSWVPCFINDFLLLPAFNSHSMRRFY